MQVYSEMDKIDPRKEVREVHNESISNMMYAAKTGDISAIQRYILLGVSIYERDYDERTVLHIAAAEDPEDRYGRTPLDDAKQFGWEKCVELLSEAHKSCKRGSAVAVGHTANSSITDKNSDSQKDAISSIRKGTSSSDIYGAGPESRNASSTQASIPPTVAKSQPKSAILSLHKSKNIHPAVPLPSAAVLAKKPDKRPTEL
uniref:Glutaminase n=1 Tax=Parascaris univalens TaxID=6257 RepID=A0A915A1K8_PARUN